MKRLYLEYCDKSMPIYDTLMRFGSDYFHLVDGVQASLESFCEAETYWISSCTERLTKLAVDRTEGNTLESLALCAFLDPQMSVWMPLAGKSGEFFDQSRLFDFVTKGLIRKVCSKVECGPLAPPRVLTSDMRHEHGVKDHFVQPIRWNVHVKSNMIGFVPTIAGGRSRYYLERVADIPITRIIAMMAKTALEHRDQVVDVLRRETPHLTMNTQLIIESYVPYACQMNDNEHDDADPSESNDSVWISKTLGKGFASELQRLQELDEMEIDWKMMEKDTWVFGFLGEAPPCEACGWEYWQDCEEAYGLM